MKAHPSLCEDIVTALILAAAIAAFILLFGCATPQPNAKPWPCERIRENEALYQELLLMRYAEEAYLWDSRSPVFTDAIHFGRLGWTDGIFPETRAYVVEADAKCAADRALVGEPVDQREKLSWWERSWLGRLLRWPARN